MEGQVELKKDLMTLEPEEFILSILLNLEIGIFQNIFIFLRKK